MEKQHSKPFLTPCPAVGASILPFAFSDPSVASGVVYVKESAPGSSVLYTGLAQQGSGNFCGKNWSELHYQDSFGCKWQKPKVNEFQPRGGVADTLDSFLNITCACLSFPAAVDISQLLSASYLKSLNLSASLH